MIPTCVKCLWCSKLLSVGCRLSPTLCFQILRKDRRGHLTPLLLPDFFHVWRVEAQQRGGEVSAGAEMERGNVLSLITLPNWRQPAAFAARPVFLIWGSGGNLIPACD